MNKLQQLGYKMLLFGELPEQLAISVNEISAILVRLQIKSTRKHGGQHGVCIFTERLQRRTVHCPSNIELHGAAKMDVF